MTTLTKAEMHIADCVNPVRRDPKRKLMFKTIMVNLDELVTFADEYERMKKANRLMARRLNDLERK